MSGKEHGWRPPPPRPGPVRPPPRCPPPAGLAGRRPRAAPLPRGESGGTLEGGGGAAAAAATFPRWTRGRSGGAPGRSPALGEQEGVPPPEVVGTAETVHLASAAESWGAPYGAGEGRPCLNPLPRGPLGAPTTSPALGDPREPVGRAGPKATGADQGGQRVGNGVGGRAGLGWG